MNLLANTIRRAAKMVPRPMMKRGTLADAEKRTIITVLRMCDGNREMAARELGIGQRTLYRKINEYGLKRRKPNR